MKILKVLTIAAAVFGISMFTACKEKTQPTLPTDSTPADTSSAPAAGPDTSVTIVGGTTISSTPPVEYVKDSYITAKVKTKLVINKLHNLTDVVVDTDSNGNVYLTGKVSKQADVDEAVSIAKSTDGVKSVTSNIEITVK